jgi:hypothetical protein
VPSDETKPSAAFGGMKRAPRGSSQLVKDLFAGVRKPAQTDAEKREMFAALQLEAHRLKREFICWAANIGLTTLKRWRKSGPPRLHEEGRLPEESAPAPVPPPPPAPEPAPAKRSDRQVADLLRKTDQQIDAELQAIEIPADFDAVRLLKKIALAPDTSRQLKAQVARAIADLEHKGKGRIPWETLSLDQIPEEIQHRLAGMLLHRVSWAELPEAVRAASADRRRAYRMIGALPTDDDSARRILGRFRDLAAELRASECPEDRPEAAAAVPITLAAEHGRTKQNSAAP